MSFSERYGYSKSRVIVQREELDDDTRVALWNLFYAYNEKLRSDQSALRPVTVLSEYLWGDYLQLPLDDCPSVTSVWSQLKDRVLRGEWYEPFNLLEFLLSTQPLARYHAELARTVNIELEKKLTAYRVINDKVVPLDSEAEGTAVASALDELQTTLLAGVRHHLSTAIDLLADRAKPDYANSVKESISAVEAILELITGEGVLSKALPKLPASGIKVHSAQVEAWKKLYGWTSDEDGVRHSAKAPPEVGQAMAKYMLVTSSAFVSLLVEEARRANVTGLI